MNISVPIFKDVNSPIDLVNNLREIELTVSNNLGKLKKIVEYVSIESYSEKSEEIIFTTYFTSNVDPQRNKYNLNNNFNYIKPWYQSIQTNNLYGIIFHDNLNNEFIDKFENENVKFVKCTIGNYSLNDERFFVYLKFIIENCFNLKKAFFTDVSDVVITKNPFELIDNNSDRMLLVGRDGTNLLKHSGYNRSFKIPQFNRAYGQEMESTFYNQAIYNAGVIGGSKNIVLYTLINLCHILKLCNNSADHNMIALNYTIFKFWYPKCLGTNEKGPNRLIIIYWGIKDFIKRKILQSFRLNSVDRNLVNNKNDIDGNTNFIMTSYPLCSAFAQYETKSDAYFIHK